MSLYHLQDRQADPAHAWLRAAAVGFFLVILAAWIATEFAAAAFHYQAALGNPLLPHLYAPLDGMVWAVRFRQVHDHRVYAILRAFWLFFGGSSCIALLTAAIAGTYWAGRARNRSDSHGSAHWATQKEIVATGLLGKTEGVYVGAWRKTPKSPVHYLRDDGPAHVLAFAPTRSGKGVGLVLPTLLSWPNSVVVHDIKGENYALTAGWRAKELGSRIIKFDATCINGTAQCFNPLLEVRRGTPYEVQDVQNIVTILCDPDGKGAEGSDAHWIVSASGLLTGIVLHVLYAEEDVSLASVANMISASEFDDVQSMLLSLLNTQHDREGVCGWTDSDGLPTSTHPVVAAAARDMLNKDPKEASSVLSTAIRFLTLFRDPVVAENTKKSDFRIRDLMHDERPLSLYLVVPPSDMARLKPLTRLIMSQILQTLTAEMSFENGKSVANYRHRLLMMIDELPSLGRLEILQSALAYMAGYGIKAYMITQDAAQLQAAYGGAGSSETIMANCHVQIAYAPNKMETMELLSKLSGQTTVRAEQRTYSGTRFGFRNSVQVSVNETERALLTPDEARRLPPDDALIFVAGHAPIYGCKIKYYNDRIFSERAKLPPPIGTEIL